MAFTPTDWKDGAGGGTPITAAELNRMEQGIADGQNAANPTVDTLTGATAVGKSVMKAVDAAAARTAIGAGTSSVKVGTGAGDALAGNTVIPAAAAAGTAAQLTTGTDTVQRTWTAKMIADEIARQIAAIPAG